MMGLDKLGIDNLSLTYRDVNKALGRGVTVAQQGTYTKDGVKHRRIYNLSITVFTAVILTAWSCLMLKKNSQI